MRDQPVIADLAEDVVIGAAMVRPDIGHDDPVGSCDGAVRAGELDPAGGDIVADDDFSVSRYGVGASFGGYPFSDLSLIFIPGSDVNVQVVYWFHVIQVDQVETAHELGLRFSI